MYGRMIWKDSTRDISAPRAFVSLILHLSDTYRLALLRSIPSNCRYMDALYINTVLITAMKYLLASSPSLRSLLFAPKFNSLASSRDQTMEAPFSPSYFRVPFD
jgi:hypothetical protein